MPDNKSRSKWDVIMGIVNSLLSPGTTTASPSTGYQPQIPQPQGVIPSTTTASVIPYMNSRQTGLTQLGPQQTGGMFDIIYRKRKEREQMLKDLDAQVDASSAVRG